jgi:hypothetical protein
MRIQSAFLVCTYNVACKSNPSQTRRGRISTIIQGGRREVILSPSFIIIIIIDNKNELTPLNINITIL